MNPIDIDKHFQEFVKKYNLAVEQLHEQQLAKLIQQMIASGDIIRYVRAGDNAQQIVYIPFARVESLETENQSLRDALKARGLPKDDGPPYYGPQIYKRTITQDDLTRAFREGRTWPGGMP